MGTGMEGSNVIYFDHYKIGINNSVRCTMTRAVSHLCIINLFTNRAYLNKFPNTKLNKKFIYCQNEFEKGDDKFECVTCKTNQICVACSIGCHHEHQTEYKGIVENKKEKCNCIKTICSIQKKRK